MPQPTELMSFRHRLKRRGYFDIHIYKFHDLYLHDLYLVEAREPLGGVLVSVKLTLIDMYRLMR